MKKSEWTQDQIDFLLEHKDDMTMKKIGEHIGKSKSTVQSYLFRNGIAKKRVKEGIWTQEQIDFLIANKDDMTYEEIGKHIGKPKHSVRTFAYRNGIKTDRAVRRFTDDEREYVESMFGMRSLKSIAKSIGRSYGAMRRYQFLNGLGRQDMNAIDRLTTTQVAEVIGVCQPTISYWCRKHELKSRKSGKFRFIKYDDLFEWMQEHPDKWDVTKCDRSFFDGLPWFDEIRKKTRENMIKERWGKWL